MNIKTQFDQIITNPIWKDGKVLGHKPTTRHYTFGRNGDMIRGGFYIQADAPLPNNITLVFDNSTQSTNEESQ